MIAMLIKENVLLECVTVTDSMLEMACSAEVGTKQNLYFYKLKVTTKERGEMLASIDSGKMLTCLRFFSL